MQKKVKYDCFFWEEDQTVAVPAESPSTRLNTAFDATFAYVDEHYDRIVTDFHRILEENESSDSDEGENDHEEPQFWCVLTKHVTLSKL